MATVVIEYFGMGGSGKNVTEAKRDAGAKIEKALSGSYNPHVLEWRGYVAIVFRCPDGWKWRQIVNPHDDFDKVKTGTVYGNRGDGTFEEAMNSARQSLAQCGWKPEDGKAAPSLFNPLCKVAIQEFESWAEFQCRYHHAKTVLGMNDNDSHSYAGRNPSRPELWLNK